MSRTIATAACFACICGSLLFSPVVVAQSADAVQAPSDAELRDRGQKLIANQHKNDEVLDRYERIEHELDTTGGSSPRTLADKKILRVPNGAGTTKLLLEDGGNTVSESEYRAELQTWANVLHLMLNPNDDRARSATSKYQKRQQSRAQLVDAMMTAFTVKWAGRETRSGRDCDVIVLHPSPSFHPKSILEDALTHVEAKVWVDRQAVQLVHAEALVTSDFSVGGGVFGKLYKGGTFSMDQAEVSPGVWLPTAYRFDFAGRKFLFPFEEHQSIEASHYRYIGSAKEAMAAAQSELANPTPLTGDP